MSDLRSLEREVSALQSQLRQQKSEAERARQRLLEENRQNLNRCREEMRRAIEQHDRQAQQKYEALLRQYERSVDGDLSRQLARTDADYRRLVEETRRNEARLAQKNTELEQAVEDIRRKTAAREQFGRSEAEARLQNAVQTFRKVETKPHEKFRPRRLSLYDRTIVDGRQLFASGLYDAAAAVAISAKAGLERLSYDIDDAAAQWHWQYELLTMKLTDLRREMASELTEWQTCTRQSGSGEDEKARRYIEINYWSRGEWAEIAQVADRLQSLTEGIEHMGRETYLRQSGGVSTEQLGQYGEEIDRAAGRLDVMRGLERARYAASCQRAEWGEQMIDFLCDEINLEWLESLSGFQTPTQETAAAKDYRDYAVMRGMTQRQEDEREWLRLVFQNATGSRIYLYLTPIEAHGRVENRVILHIDYGGAEQESYSREIYAHVCEAIGLPHDSKFVHYAADLGELKTSAVQPYRETAKEMERLIANELERRRQT